MSENLPHIWRPYTQMKTAKPPLPVIATHGSRIVLEGGRELIDGVASWWTACHGYNHPHILDVMSVQLRAMPHVMFGGLTHEPARELAARLATLTPGDLDHVFFVDSGSVAVEVALKMAVQYWLNKGEVGRTKFVSFRHGYHGDTAACMSLCDPEEGMHAHFEGYLPKQYLADLPEEEKSVSAFDMLLAEQGEHIAGVIVEPMVQGVGGMRFQAPGTLQKIAELCARHGVLLIADEIFTGFGRTGPMFACEQAGVVPDIMCLGKALTAGMLTLAATVARKHVFEAFWSDDPLHALMHGPTYMANPLACAAANASLDVFEQEQRLAAMPMLTAALEQGLSPCRKIEGVKDVRVMGGIGVVQLTHKIKDHEPIRAHLIAQGVWVRSWDDCVYLTPPLNIAGEDLAKLTQSICLTVAHFAPQLAKTV